MLLRLFPCLHGSSGNEDADILPETYSFSLILLALSDNTHIKHHIAHTDFSMISNLPATEGFIYKNRYLYLVLFSSIMLFLCALQGIWINADLFKPAFVCLCVKPRTHCFKDCWILSVICYCIIVNCWSAKLGRYQSANKVGRSLANGQVMG